MAKDRSEDPEHKKEKKDKKDKKRKHSESVAPVDDAEVEVVAERKKKDKKRKSTSTADNTTSVLNAIEADRPGAVAVDADGDVVVDAGAGAEVGSVKVEDDEDDEKKAKIKVDTPLAALVPFANPLCEEKDLRKVLKGVKKAAKSRAIKRGVKEVVKSVRKSPLAQPTTPATATTTPGIVILAADISPMDVISHIPVLCEDHSIPYVYVPSRAELGAAGSTKRPTSVVMVTPRGKEGQEEWEGTYGELFKLAGRLGRGVRV